MTDTAILERDSSAASAKPRPARAKDDATMLKAAANLTRDLNTPSSRIYWADMLGSALIGYGALFATMALSWPAALATALFAIGAAVKASDRKRPPSPSPLTCRIHRNSVRPGVDHDERCPDLGR